MAIATSMHVTPADVLDYLLTLTPTEETLVYGSGRGQLRCLAFLLDYTQAWLSPLPLYQCLNAGRPGVLYESVDIAPIYGRYSLAVIDPPVIVEGRDERFLGLYGAFAYDFVHLFEPLPDRLPAISTQDFRLFMPDMLLSYDHMRERAVFYLYDFLNSTKSAHALLRERLAALPATAPPPPASPQVRIPHKLLSDTGREAFMTAVDDAREQMRLGEFFEVVLSHSFKGRYDRSPLELYRRFREINPSPYQFYVDYGDEALVGASPEMFVRVENGIVQQRPISGTMPRGTDSLTDYHNMMRLLNSEKEKSELDMLIDLARNDVSRVCEPGVAVSDYRYVEKYSRVMHTVTQVEGRLAAGWTAFDAFIASLNAG